MFIHVDPNGHVPIYLQIIEQIKRAVAAGLMEKGDKLPSVRELSRQININPNTIARSYQELEREGVIETIRGVGTFVCSTPPKISQKQRREKIVERLKDLFTEAYHLQIDKDELYRIFKEEMDKWRFERGGEDT